MTRLRALFAASTLLLAACPTAGMHIPAGSFTLAVSPAAPAPGDTLRMVATLANPGADTVTLSFASNCVVGFYVRSEPDRAVVEPEGGTHDCAPTQRMFVVAPGESQRFEHAWIAPAAAPHAYTAYALIAEHHVIRGTRPELKLGHRSNEVAIQVRPR